MSITAEPFQSDWVWDVPPDVMSAPYYGNADSGGESMIVISFQDEGFAVLTQEAAAKLVVRLACEIEAAHRFHLRELPEEAPG